MKTTAAILTLLFLLGIRTDLQAQYLTMTGVGRYSRVGSVATLSVDRIDHLANPFSIASGTLYLQLWACLTPYNGLQTSLGYKVAESTLDPLFAGYFYSPVVRTVPLYAPPNGTYYMVLVLAESDGLQPLTVDWINFSYKETFGPPPPSPDRISPTVSITAPINPFAATTSNRFLLRGKANDNRSPTGIQFRIRAPGKKNFGNWISVSLPAGIAKTKFWSRNLILNVRGTWIIETRARDKAGNIGRAKRVYITRR